MSSKVEFESLCVKRVESQKLLKLYEESIEDLQSIGELQSVLNRLRTLYNKYDDIQCAIDHLVHEHDDTLVLNDAENTDVAGFRRNFEIRYGIAESKILNAIYDHEYAQKPNNAPNNEPSVSVKLPEISLPSFNGDEENWVDFKSVFIDLIHKNVKLSKVSKFHYLLSCLKNGKAFKFVDSLPITSGNYDVAWDKLYSHYNNEVSIQKRRMKLLYDIKKPQDSSASSLSNFIETIEKQLSALNSLGVETTSWDLFLYHHVLEKLDSTSKIEVLKKTTHDKILTIAEVLDILKLRVRILETLSSNVSKNANVNDPNRFKSNSVSHNNNKFSNKILTTTSSNNCLFCNEGHLLVLCPKFTNEKLTPSKRFDFVKRHKLCTNCLSSAHRVSECTSRSCYRCSLKHHTLLHFEKRSDNHGSSNYQHVDSNFNSRQNTNSSRNIPSTSSNLITQPERAIESSSTTLSVVQNSSIIANNNSNFCLNSTIIGTALIWVESHNGHRTLCRTVLDSCSNYNFVTERLCQLINPFRTSVNIPIAGINGKTSVIKHGTTLNIYSRISEFAQNLNFLIIPKITGNMPSSKIQFDPNQLPASIQLADPKFFVPEKIDMLLGIEVYHEIMFNESIRVIRELPPFQNSAFGYVVAGKINHQTQFANLVNSINSSSYCFMTTGLESQIQKFWELESIPSSTKSQLSADELKCENHYVENTIRQSDGRYSVALPVSSNISQLGTSMMSALKQFQYLEIKLNKNENLRNEYCRFMTEYSNLSHMEIVNKVDETDSCYNKTFFFPHHAVFKNSSTTTKVRVVFNASCKSSSHLSLNDVLLKGPTIQQDLISIVLRFRKHLIAISADITKMYRQILLHPNQRDLHRIWWRDQTDNVIKCFRLKTVTYGTTSAPFLAIRTLKKLADDDNVLFPAAAEVLRSDFYVDDLLSGADSQESALSLKSDLCNLLLRGGFELCKWASNDNVINLESKNEQEHLQNILGLHWDTSSDTFDIVLKQLPTSIQCTKRSILSEIAQLYDPLGLIAPVVFIAKKLMQSIWQLADKSWDDVLSDDILQFWNNFKQQLLILKDLKIPRCVKSCASELFEIHAFGDASESGYGCVVCVRTKNEDGSYLLRLLCAKSRVAPLKRITIPRLELCAAVLVAQVVDKILSIMDTKVSGIFNWTDSEITLFRIRTCSSKFATFVGNRIAVIQELSNSENWFHVPTTLNPADMVSRGLLPNDFLNSDLWWKGPQFLYQNQEYWPKCPGKKIDIEQLELRKDQTVMVTQQSNKFDLIHRFSDLNKLVRVVAICLRFCQNCKIVKGERNIEKISIHELNVAMIKLVQNVQMSEYPNEIMLLTNKKSLSPRNKLLSLNPFLDSNGTLRVGGRIVNAEVKYDQKFPMIIPGSHFLSTLIARNEHIRLLHAGPQQLLYSLRTKYWITNGRSLCKNIVFKCLRCFRARPKTIDQIMGSLPSSRVTPARPFLFTGVDFCGPFEIKYRVRTKCFSKVYIAVFICFTTKAIHLELVDDLTSQAFISCLRRFAARRGRSSIIFSDNATNFIGARNELNELYKLFTSQTFQTDLLNYCNNENIEWKTIPAKSPHFGGLWEAAVKSAKHHLHRIAGNQRFTESDLNTLIIQIESCLNSRPLSPMSSDPSDLMVLTPAHFLIGEPLTSFPDPDLQHLQFNRLKNYQQVQHQVQLFWKRWSTCYLSELQQRRKWKKDSNVNIEVGTLVLMKEDNVPPLNWVTARIIKVHPGNDGIVHVVTVKTRNSEFKRSITKICILPIDENPSCDLQRFNCDSNQKN